MELGKEVSHHDDRAQCYAFRGKTNAEAFDVVTTCTILVCDQKANVI